MPVVSVVKGELLLSMSGVGGGVDVQNDGLSLRVQRIDVILLKIENEFVQIPGTHGIFESAKGGLRRKARVVFWALATGGLEEWIMSKPVSIVAILVSLGYLKQSLSHLFMARVESTYGVSVVRNESCDSL